MCVSLVATKPPVQHVRGTVAFEGKAEVARSGHFGSVLTLDGRPRDAQHLALAPVAASTQYVRVNAPLESGQLVITPELTNVFHQADVLKLIDKCGLASSALDYATDLEFARVQQFTAALRVPGKNEQIVSIRWRATHETKENDFGIMVWGIFVREGNGPKQIHLVVNRAYADYDDDDEFEVLAVGDLNGDGIDELITRGFMDEPEDDRVALLEWERGALVSLYDTH
jgi:hypothetical protein